jgi:hypothetical protein
MPTGTTIGFPKKKQPVIDQSCVGYWKFDEASGNIKDWSGKGNTGTAYNLTYSQAGKFGNACSFNGTSSYVDCGNGANLYLSDVTTITSWIKATSSGDYTITSKGDSWYNYADKEFQYKSGRLCYRDTIYSQLIPSFYNGLYHHVAVVGITNSPVKFYFDGVDVSESTTVLYGSDAGTNNSKMLNIGRRIVHDAPQQFLNGLIDEIRIYNRALSPQEIKRQYMAGR